MPHLCEITLKKYRRTGVPSARGQKSEKKGKRPELLKRKIQVPEAKGSIQLHVSPEGLEIVKQAGGLAKFLKDRDDKKLSTKLIRLKRKIYGVPKEEKPKEEAKEAKEAKPEAPPPEGKAPEEKVPEAAAEKPAG